MTTPILLRPYTQDDHPLLADWWLAHSHPVIPAPAIPPFAWLVHDGDPTATDRAFACAYMDNGGSGLAYLAWIVTNPANTPRQSAAALATLLPFMRDYLTQDLDYGYILATSPKKSLSTILARHGFAITDRDTSHLLHIHTRTD